MKKLLSLLLVLSLCLALSLPAFAGGEGPKSVAVALNAPCIGDNIDNYAYIPDGYEGYYIAGVSWDPPHERFHPGVSYSVTVTVEPLEGESFSTEATYYTYINQNVATILSRSADQIKFSHTFEPLEGSYDSIWLRYLTDDISIAQGDSYQTMANYLLPEEATDVSIQWYVGDTPSQWGSPVPGATTRTLTVPSDTPGVKYYRCHITAMYDGQPISTRTEEFETIRVEVTERGLPSMFFSDVTIYDWFYHDVEFVYYDQLMNGTGNGRFSPHASCTRGQIVTILHRLVGSPAVSGACPFGDVKAGSYYEKAITWAAENQIVNGVGNGRFAPDASITREQLATILCRFAQWRGVFDEDDCVMTAGFKDQSAVSGWAQDAMSWAVGVGLIGGTTRADGLYLDPQGLAQRCQVAAILHRYVNSFGN